MLFDSSAFLIFFAVFLLCYYFVRGRLFLRNLLILAASFVFYGYWDPRFLLLLTFTATVDFGMAMLVEDAARPGQRKRYLVASLVTNLVVLGFFKYFNFFVQSFQELAASVGWQVQATTLSIILPVGISFYTFQSMGYVIDVYRGKLPACRNILQFLAYVSFFPQLVAGPIERAPNLLPQFQRTLTVTYSQVEAGIWLVLIGLFKKIVIADNLAPFVDLAYNHPDPDAALVSFGTVAFAFQVYCDFSGYSDIARGLAKLLGFELRQNFNLPYFALNLREFWQRWHISLSTWFRDYLYIPLGGNQCSRGRNYFNLFTVMFLAGLWHGARANFLLWGLWQALGLILHRAWCEFKRPRWSVPAPLAWTITSAWVLAGWMLFRADSIDSIYRYVNALATNASSDWTSWYVRSVLWLTVPFYLFQFAQWKRGEAAIPFQVSTITRAVCQALVVLGILVYAQGGAPRPFIYFQF
jgi:alginate O-acetyltransferase complex protein AlgI